MMNMTMLKLGSVMMKAALIFERDGCSYQQAVSKAFNESFGSNEQSEEMQDVYLMLCNMGYTPRLD